MSLDIKFHSLYETLKKLSPAMDRLHFNEFKYCMEAVDVTTDNSIHSPDEWVEIINNPKFYRSIELKPIRNNRIILDKNITELRRQLFVGLMTNVYSEDWVAEHFYFDVRSFVFLPTTKYLTEEVVDHVGENPMHSFTKHQDKLKTQLSIGFNEFSECNSEIDECLADLLYNIVRIKKTPVIIGLAGPTAAGKTEFADNLREKLINEKRTVTTVEMDNFFLDRSYREENRIDSYGKESLHFHIMLDSIKAMKDGFSPMIPQYDFITGDSSHDHRHNLRKNCSSVKVESADVIYIDGNFPFLFDELVDLIDIKIVYLTSDEIRLKRKWRRDVDCRKKYDPNYLINRYFRTQFLKAQDCYLPQLKKCDIAVDTTDGKIYFV